MLTILAMHFNFKGELRNVHLAHLMLWDFHWLYFVTEFMEAIENVVSHLVAYAFEQGKNPIFNRKFSPLISAQGIRCTDLLMLTRCTSVIHSMHF